MKKVKSKDNIYATYTPCNGLNKELQKLEKKKTTE